MEILVIYSHLPTYINFLYKVYLLIIGLFRLDFRICGFI